VLRILHTLLLAAEGGFLVHAASAVRNGRAFLFAGLSGAGKTTIAGLAPPDATLLTDEISYVRKLDDHYYAFGRRQSAHYICWRRAAKTRSNR
jgi:ABC-type iron transport system FetAB ATPase subunit